MNFEQIDIDKIICNDRGREDLGDIDELIASINTNGLLEPIIISDQYELLAGGRRYTACKQLGFKEIPAVILKNVSQEDKLVIELIENTHRKDFHWSEAIKQKLKIYESMIEQDSDCSYRDVAKKLNCSLGGLSSDLEMAKVLKVFPQLSEMATKAKARESYKKLQQHAEAASALKSLSQEDKDKLKSMLGGVDGQAFGDGDVVENTPGEQASQKIQHEQQVPGTVASPQQESPVKAHEQPTSNLPEFSYQIKDFKDFISEIPNNIVGFAELDPPYAINFDTTYGQTSNIKSKEKDWTVEQLMNSMEWLLKNLYKKLLDDSWVLCWTAKEHWKVMNNLAEQAGFTTQAPGVWAKPSGVSNHPRTSMVSQYEMFLLFRKGKAQFNVASFPNVITIPTLNHNNRLHQWEKPIDLYNKFMSACGKPNTIFISPFARSGMSMVSAALSKMKPFGCDLQQKHFYRFLSVFKETFGGN